jgi:proteasome accessory factor B
MALLATKRFLSKGEIFTQVAGYEGSPETKERMFERDKDDLRALGIEIQVGSHDAYFDDELGYRILESDYELNIGDLTPIELSYLSLASKMWRNQLFAESGSLALVKIDAHSGSALREDFGTSVLSLENETPLFAPLWEAITTHRNISFTYRSKGTSKRHISPYGLTLWRGSWYLVGLDLDKSEIRVFKVARIASDINFESKTSSFSIPEDFRIQDHLVMLQQEPRIAFTAKVRVGKCQSLRNEGAITNIDGEWDRINFSLGSDWLERILWFGSDVIVESPEERVAEIKDVLRSKL